LPTFTDLFYEGPTNTGNPNLTPEEAVSFETGFKGNIGSFRFEFGGFKRYGRNMIDWVKSADEEKWRAVNHTRVDISGVEIGAHYSPSNIDFSRKGNYEVSLTYSCITANKLSDQLISNYVLDHLRHKLDLKLWLQANKWASFSTSLSYRHRNGSYLLFENGAFVGSRNFEPYYMADINLQLRASEKFTISLGATNLFNAHFVSISNVRQPGRWVVGKITYLLEK
jgi:iron complex outermembrane receptor protein